MSQTKPQRAIASDEWETPMDFVLQLANELGPFDLDPAATHQSRKAPAYFTPEDNGLEQPWFGRVFCNPPFSQLRFWIRKAIAEARRGVQVVMILPAATDRDWFHEDVLPNAQVRFLRARRPYYVRADGSTGRPKFASMLAIFMPPGSAIVSSCASDKRA